MQDTNLDQQEHLHVLLKDLKKVDEQIRKLTHKKRLLTEEVVTTMGHNKPGQKTFEVAEFKVKITMPQTFSLDKEKYLAKNYELPPEYNPIKESVTYSVDKKMFEFSLENAPAKVKRQLCDLITTKAGTTKVEVS